MKGCYRVTFIFDKLYTFFSFLFPFFFLILFKEGLNWIVKITKASLRIFSSYLGSLLTLEFGENFHLQRGVEPIVDDDSLDTESHFTVFGLEPCKLNKSQSEAIS